jgi:imidazolonepropionase-like amidohydrolase
MRCCSPTVRHSRGRWQLAGPAAALAWLVAPAGAQMPSPTGRSPVLGAPTGVTAFVDVNVVPMDTERVLRRQTVLVEGGRVAALGPSAKVPVPAGAVRIEGRGQYLLPGLGDMHVHLGVHTRPMADSSAYTAAAEDRLFLWLSEGITTVRNLDYEPVGYNDMRLEGADLLRFRARAAAGELWSPRIHTSGPWWLSLPGNPGRDSREGDRKPTQPDSVAAYLHAYQAAGFDFIKYYGEPSTLLAVARQLGIPVVGHAPTRPLAPLLATGMRSIEHLTGYVTDRRSKYERFGHLRSVPDHPDSLRAWARATRRAGVWNVPTLFHNEFLLNHDPGERTLAYHLLKAFQDAGAGLLLGTDAPHGTPRVPGHGDPGKIHDELETFVLAGLTPYQALVAGTRNVAAYFGTLNESGTIAVGKRADLVLLYGDPLQVIRNTRRPAGVMVGGRWLARRAIDQRVDAIRAGAAPARAR